MTSTTLNFYILAKEDMAHVWQALAESVCTEFGIPKDNVQYALYSNTFDVTIYETETNPKEVKSFIRGFCSSAKLQYLEPNSVKYPCVAKLNRSDMANAELIVNFSNVTCGTVIYGNDESNHSEGEYTSAWCPVTNPTVWQILFSPSK